MPPIRRLLIANRGEIALRIARSARERGVETVAVHAPEDAALAEGYGADAIVPLAGRGAAAYLDAWKRRIETVGAAYLPELGNIRDLAGSPTMLVRIGEDGTLIEARVSRSSGSPLLDLASVDIIQRASPFDEFPEQMAAEYDTVAFEYKFLFTEQLVPRD